MKTPSMLALAGLAPFVVSAPALAGDSDGPQFKLKGLFFADAAWLDGAAASGRDSHESDLRLAEVSLRFNAGSLYGAVGYDFARDGEWRDVGLSLKQDGFTFTVGQFKEIASLDKLGPQGGTVFMEAARLTKAFGIGRRLGVSAGYAGDNFTLTVAAYNGSLDAADASGRGPGQTAYSIRGTATPVREDDFIVHLGAYARHLDYDGAGVKLSAGMSTVLAASTLSTKLTASSPFGAADTSTLYGLEAGLVRGRWFASGEFATMNIDTPVMDDSVTAGYLQASVALTGESRGYSGSKGVFTPVTPASPVTQGGVGAWELAARIDRVDLSAFNGGESTAYTAGVTWTPVQGVRVMANYTADRDNDFAGDSDVWAVRLQASF